MNAVVARIDRWQRSRAWLAFPYAVVRKYGEDGAGRHAALVAYYAFVAIFPLLLLLVTVSDLVLRARPDLQQQLLDGALGQLPIIGPQLGGAVEPLQATGAALAVGVLGALWGARGMATAMIAGAAAVWNIPAAHRPGMAAGLARALALTVTIGVGLVASTVASSLVAAGPWGPWASAVGFVVALLLNIGVFLAGFRMAVPSVVATRDLRIGAALAATCWQLLQLFGGLLVVRVMAGAGATYGTFAVVIGLVTYLSLAATASLAAMEVDVVRARDLWPRSLSGGDPTDGDHRAEQSYVAAARIATSGESQPTAT